MVEFKNKNIAKNCEAKRNNCILNGSFITICISRRYIYNKPPTDDLDEIYEEIETTNMKIPKYERQKIFNTVQVSNIDSRVCIFLY